MPILGECVSGLSKCLSGCIPKRSPMSTVKAAGPFSEIDPCHRRKRRTTVACNASRLTRKRDHDLILGSGDYGDYSCSQIRTKIPENQDCKLNKSEIPAAWNIPMADSCQGYSSRGVRQRDRMKIRWEA